MSGLALLYGANGFTGRLLAQKLRESGADIVLAGRSAEKLRPLAEDLGLPFRTFPLGDPARIQEGLEDVSVVIHAAGPFVDTASPMMAACIRTRTHYLDLAGEWPVFAEAEQRSMAAASAGVMLMPGVGFTLVASDCLLALAAHRVDQPQMLRLAISHPDLVARGTLRSAAGLIGASALVRRDGRLTTAPIGSLQRAFDFGEGLRSAIAITWPDVITGELTTGTPNIEAYVEAGPAARLVYQAYAQAVPWTDARAWRAMSHAFTRMWPREPSAERRRNAGLVLVAEAVDRWRRSTRLRMRTLDGYTVSVLTTAEIVRRVLDGDWTPGFNTPARMFGADFILQLGCAAVEPA